MLEEALRNEKHNPSETALAMLAFLQQDLTAGGAAAEARFYKTLYGPLCERIFGAILGEKDNYRHDVGGWLSVQYRWSRAPSSVVGGAGAIHGGSSRSTPGRQIASNATSHLTRAPSWESDPVVRLLATAGRNTSKNGEPLPPTLIEAISYETENHPQIGFPLPFYALPKATQEAWMNVLRMSYMGAQGVAGTHQQQQQPGGGVMGVPHAHTSADHQQHNLAADVVVSENDNRLFKHLLRKPPIEQHALNVAMKQKDKNLHHPRQSTGSTRQLSPRNMNSPMRDNRSNNGTPNKNAPSTEEEAQPNVILSMLEYYLFVFIRFLLYMPLPNSSAVQGAGIYTSHQQPFGEKVYSYLFQRYLRHFLPYQREGDRPINSDQFPPSSELFLRVIIALWMESQCRVVQTQKVVHSIVQRRNRAGISDTPRFDLSSSYDLTVAKYDVPPGMVKSCMRKLVAYALLDPQTRSLVAKHQQRIQGQVDQSSRIMTNTMTALQQPFYNYVRTTFRYALIHANSSPFLFALDVWLQWLEPWNVTIKPKTQLTAPTQIIGSITSGDRSKQSTATTYSLHVPKCNERSKYDARWEPYIASNVLMYAVPLALFLRRAREFDFSANKFEKSIQLVKRVFRVFTPDLVTVISRHLSSVTDPSVPNQWSYLVQQHLHCLGPYAPPNNGPLPLSSCQADMHSLLEEIYMQHMKKVRDLDVFSRMAASLEGIFGKGVVSGEEKELTDLVERAKLIVGLPIEYEILPGGITPQQSIGRKGASSLAGTEKPRVRTKNGMLTQAGRDTIFRGEAKCSLADVSYQGDKMRAGVGSHEIPMLVQATIFASDLLNTKFGLIGPSATESEQSVAWWKRFRVNLRFLADYRNLIFLFFITYVFIKIG